jgi:predicted nuclease of predicted toxin-antitoxin system
VDMPLSPALADWLAAQGHDAVHASNTGLARAADSAILERARGEQWVVITADLDYPRLLALSQADRPGVILFRGGQYGEQEAVERPARVLELIPGERLTGSMVVIDKTRTRRRRLPLYAVFRRHGAGGSRYRAIAELDIRCSAQ